VPATQGGARSSLAGLVCCCPFRAPEGTSAKEDAGRLVAFGRTIGSRQGRVSPGSLPWLLGLACLSRNVSSHVNHFVFGAALALFASEKCKAEEISDTNSLRVVIVPTRTHVRIREHSTLTLRVANPTTTNQYVRVMSCSWPQQWKSSSPSISCQNLSCILKGY
jgi:hypothetical protein